LIYSKSLGNEVIIKENFMYNRKKGSIHLKISKTKFFNYIRCNRYVALEEITYQRDKAVVSFDESLEDLYTQELEEKKMDLLRSLFDNLSYEESDFEEDNDFDPLLDNEGTELIRLLQPQYEMIEQMTAIKVKELFGGTIISDRNTFQQKYIETEIDGFHFFAFLDTFQEDNQISRIIETKASTSNKFVSKGYTVNKEKVSIFSEDSNGIYRLKGELGIDVDEEKYKKQKEKLLDKFDGAGKYVYDLAYQRFIDEQSNKSNKQKVYYLAVLNHQYIYDGKKDNSGRPIYNPMEIISLIDLTQITKDLQPIIRDEVNRIINRLNMMQAAPVPMGKHCQKDKATRECPFIDICLNDKKVPKKNSLFTYRNYSRGFSENRYIKKSPKHDVYDLIDEGITNLLDIPREWLSEIQKIQYDVIGSGQPHIEKEMIKEGIKSLKYPLYHLDFESFASPLPRYVGEKPYQQSLFQFSLHIEHKNEVIDKDDNFYYLAQDHEDHREDLVKKMIEYIPMNEGNIIVYNKGFESGRINELIQLFPQYENHLSSIRERIFDLLYLIRAGDKFYEQLGFSNEQRKTLIYYDENFQRSYSIKQVLPVFVPELSYKNLEEVQNGQQAQIAYYKMPHLADSERVKTYNNMLEYCKQDTWAMLLILEKLRVISEIKKLS
jgi:hypothetical protein